MIPLVAASEKGRGQPESHFEKSERCGETK